MKVRLEVKKKFITGWHWHNRRVRFPDNSGSYLQNYYYPNVPVLKAELVKDLK